MVLKVFISSSFFLTLCYNSSIIFPELVRFFPILDHSLCRLRDLSMEYFDAYNFTVSTMGVTASLVFLILSLYVEPI